MVVVRFVFRFVFDNYVVRGNILTLELNVGVMDGCSKKILVNNLNFGYNFSLISSLKDFQKFEINLTWNTVKFILYERVYVYIFLMKNKEMKK